MTLKVILKRKLQLFHFRIFVARCKLWEVQQNIRNLKNVGLLLFSENPEKYIPCSRIELVQFLDNIGDRFIEKLFVGAIHNQLKEVLAYIQNQIIRQKVVKIANKAEAMRFYNYPFGAIEEALANAVYHKSYDQRNPIEVRINHNCIEILSFEGPMPPITNIDLQKNRVITRQYRNRRIGDFLKELKYTEGRSTGFPKIYRELQTNGSPLPKFETDETNSYFLTTIYSHPLFAEKERELNDKEKVILNYCKEPRSSREILTFVGVSYHSKNLKTIIAPLVDAGLLLPIDSTAGNNNLKYLSVEIIEE